MALFGLGKKKAQNTGACENCAPASAQTSQAEQQRSEIKVLGGGCAKCHELTSNTEAALASLGLNDEVSLVTDYAVIAAYGVMSTPALVVDEKVVSAGKVLKRDEIAAIIQKTRAL